jgi:hypothetical protein
MSPTGYGFRGVSVTQAAEHAGMGPFQVERTRLLVIRMWLEAGEPAGFRARVGELADGGELHRTAVFGAPELTIADVAGRIRTFGRGERGSPSPP